MELVKSSKKETKEVKGYGVRQQTKGCSVVSGRVWERFQRLALEDFPGGAADRNLPSNAGGTGSIPGLRRFHIPEAARPRCHNH